MDLVSEDVARHIQKASEARGSAFPMGAAVSAWYWLDKLLPNALRHRLARYLVGR
jgi:hypothetical protein